MEVGEMTKPIFQRITDEQLYELEEICRQQAFDCCRNFSTGGEYMGAQELVCCMEPISTERDISWPAESILDIVNRLRTSEKDASRYRWFRDNSLMIVSVRTDWVQHLDQCIDEEMHAQQVRHASLMPLDIADPRRKCHSPECWCCHGTGVSQRPDVPGICDMNDKIPF